ncbi:MAG: hypothetical protein KJ676_07815 [Alphaproteobacteria bacterium]|nr:hypothetical protein [Alphaproteobacteria bacterium]MBU1527283.1 hypothetical protein [Alphaproteobacteria bacterium]MBU2118079.1 hypothetical protein [Alphaproteobacteria bacterium]MBU2352011.1 hypothetical protein [Alphaproteobacteria bacterium]MBU2381997.1 hypothetical protein [Alphaproteobacteria bacterium]
MDRRRLILGGAAGAVAACASSPQTPLTTPPPDDRLMFAQAHLELHPRVAAQHFDCAVGARFGAAPRPALTGVFERLAREVEVRVPHDVTPAEGTCARLRPGEGRVLGVSRRAALVAAYSGALSRMAPDRAGAIAARAGDLLESERLCGLADEAAQNRGGIAGRDAFMALVQGEDGFRTRLEQAAAEVAEARRDPLESPGCAAERRALSPLPDAG